MNKPFNQLRALRWAKVIMLGALCGLGYSNSLLAQSGCAGQSSFQFPLWNDGVKWNLPGNYTSIQLADIDGDGQDELLGYGPFGIEIWHWDPNGEAWLQMPAGTPRFGPTDLLMTADVNGDGQAEIMQVTPAQSANGTNTVSVWHYDAAAQVWQVQPSLQLNLPASTDVNNNVLSPMIQFADMHKSGRQELVYLYMSGAYNAESPVLLAVPAVYQVKANGNAWSNSLTTATQAILTSNAPGGPFRIGDVTNASYGATGDGLPDVVLEQPGGFIVWPQQASSSANVVAFNAAKFSALGVAGPGTSTLPPIGNFAFVYDPANNVQDIAAIPLGLNLQVFIYAPNALVVKTGVPPSIQLYGPSQYETVQSAITGLNPDNPTATSVLILGSDGLDEYGFQVAQFNKISNTPFVSETRFGDEPSHYETIQTGHVAYGVNGAVQPIIVARDASGMHTLIRSTNVCQTGVAGFTLPQAKYYPPFIGGQAAAYSYISNAIVAGNYNIRSLYPNDYASLPSYEATLAGLSYPSGQKNLAFTQNDFNAVKAQLNAEFLAAGNTLAYFSASSAQVNNLFSGEEADLQSITTALNLPSDVTLNPSSSPGYIFSQISTQIISNIFFGLGSDSDAEAHIGVASDDLNAAAIAISAIGTVISDAVSFSSSGSSLSGQTLIVENQVTSWHTAAATQNAIAQTAALQNFDVMSAISDQIGNGTLAVSSVAEDTALNAGLTQFQVGTWQALTPQVWEIAAIPEPGLGDNNPGYPYQLEFPLNLFENGGYYSYVDVYPAIPSTVGFSVQLPVAQAAVQQLLSLGVQLNDILGQRNGWQNLPFTANGYAITANNYSVPPDPTPAPPPTPVIGAPATLNILSGGQETAQIYACGSLPRTAILKQSAPVYSVFPEPITLQVQDANGNGVPNATIQVKGTGLNPTTSTFLTDINGYGSVSLLANGVVQPTYNASLQVTSPAGDTSYPACSTKQTIELENTPAPPGGTTAAGIQVVAGLGGGSGPAAARSFTLKLEDKTGSSTAMQLNSLTLQASGSTCNPVITTTLPEAMTGPDLADNFTSPVTFNVSGCKGAIPTFTVTVNATSTITLTDGTTYNVPATGSLTNFKP